MICSHCLYRGNGWGSILGKLAVFLSATGGPTGAESACNNWEFLKGVLGENFLQKVSPSMPSNASEVLQPLLITLSSTGNDVINPGLLYGFSAAAENKYQIVHFHVQTLPLQCHLVGDKFYCVGPQL